MPYCDTTLYNYHSPLPNHSLMKTYVFIFGWTYGKCIVHFCTLLIFFLFLLIIYILFLFFFAGFHSTSDATCSGHDLGWITWNNFPFYAKFVSSNPSKLDRNTWCPISPTPGLKLGSGHAAVQPSRKETLPCLYGRYQEGPSHRSLYACGG